MTTIVTLALDAAAQAHFEDLRQQHYPAALNRIPAHVSLFHALPGEDSTGSALRQAAAAVAPFGMSVQAVRSLGRGVAYWIASPELQALHARLAREFADHLSAQDKQRYAPHVVVQNKVGPAEAKELLAALQAGFVPWRVQATGLLWWEYLGGPWRLIETMPFTG